MKWASKTRGFTIVELLIVIVVIAILAAITIVAYTGVQNRAQQSAAAATLRQAVTKIGLYIASNNSTLPPTLAAADVVPPQAGISYYPVSTTLYCLSTTTTSNRSYYLRSDATGTIQEGSCEEPGWVGGTTAGFNEQPGTSPVLNTAIGPGQDVTLYVVFSVANANFGFLNIAGIYPAPTSTNPGRFYFQGASSGSTSAGYRFDSTQSSNIAGLQSNVRTPGLHIGWLQSSNNATTRAFAYDQVAAVQVSTLDGGPGWNFERLTLAGTSSSFSGVSTVAYTSAHDEATRKNVMNWLAKKYNTGQSF